jgi:NitT/TauT family transport system ATP-binding protein
MTKTKIVAKEVRKTFRTGAGSLTALDSFNLEIDEGQFVCILGPSGCGKSTFLRMVAGLAEPSSGTITMDGKPIHGPHPDRGLVFQEYALFPWLSVLQNVMYGPLVRGIDRKRAEQTARQQIGRVGLAGFEDYFPRQLSGGMKQRVGIARVWANQPQVMLMDEPFGALDNITRGILQKDLLKLWLEERKTVLFITHSVEEAIYLADTIIVMSSRPGRIVATIKVSETRPRNLLGPQAMALRAELSELVEHQIVPAA